MCVMWMAGDTVKKCGTPSAPAAPACFDSAGRGRFLFLLPTTLRDAQSSGMLEWIGIKNAEPTEVQHCQDSRWRFINTRILHIQAKKETSLLNSRPLFLQRKAFHSVASRWEWPIISSTLTSISHLIEHIETNQFTTYGLKHLLQHILPQLSE